MDDLTLRYETAQFLSTGDPNAILTSLPSGSGVLHIANTQPANWVSGYVGSSAGRWKIHGQEKKHFGDRAETSVLELAGLNHESMQDKVFEEWEITANTLAINVSCFPSHLQNAYFEDHSPAPGKWAKSHILIEELHQVPAFKGISSILAPSASGLALGISGLVLVADPRSTPMRMIRTGAYSDFFPTQD